MNKYKNNFSIFRSDHSNDANSARVLIRMICVNLIQTNDIRLHICVHVCSFVCVRLFVCVFMVVCLYVCVFVVIFEGMYGCVHVFNKEVMLTDE